MDISIEAFDAITKATLRCYPNEMVGIISDGKFVELTNVSPSPETHFSVDPLEYEKMVDVEFIVHSHTTNTSESSRWDLRTPSNADLINQRAGSVPWLIVGTEGENVMKPIRLPHVPNNEYLDRRFIWYVSDCYTLVKDYYQFEYGIFLRDHPVEFDWGVDCFDNIIERHFGPAGFIHDVLELENIQNGDLLLLGVMDTIKNHLGIYEDGYVIEQMGISRRRPIRNYRSRIVRIVRHENKFS